jgi:multidrug efflux pump subunit AcrA (membrane-fusion protein)
LFYALFAIVVFGMIGSTIYDRLSGIRLQHGRVMAPMVEHRISEAAFVDEIRVAVGDEVNVGDLLVVLNAPERDGALDAVRLDIRLTERRLEDAQLRLDRLQSRRAGYKHNLDADIAREIALRNTRDFLGGYHMSGVEAALAALAAFENLTSPLALEFQELEAQLSELFEDRNSDLRQLKRDLSNAKDSNDAINIVAQVDGIVRELPLVEDLHQIRGTLGAVIEENSPRQVVGWISERASQDLYVGQNARLRVARPEGSKSLSAKIVDVTAGVDPARPTEFGLVVTFQTDQADLVQNRMELRPNAPIEIRADRGWALTPFVLAFRAWWT